MGNPECYRMFEAIEAGSIPVLVRTDLGITDKEDAHPCRGALHEWREAPILLLHSWGELFPTMEKLFKDKARLDWMQNQLFIWYEDHMRGVVTNFEDFMLESSVAMEDGVAGENAL